MTKKERGLYRPPSAKEVAQELHALQRADADANRRSFLRDVLAECFAFDQAMRKDVEGRVRSQWRHDPSHAVPPAPPSIPEALRLVEELFAVERAMDRVGEAWRNAVARPLSTRPRAQFGAAIMATWIEETSTRARRETLRAADVFRGAVASLASPKCDARVRLSEEDLASAEKSGSERAGAFACGPARSPYVRSQAPMGDNRQ